MKVVLLILPFLFGLFLDVSFANAAGPRKQVLRYAISNETELYANAEDLLRPALATLQTAAPFGVELVLESRMNWEKLDFIIQVTNIRQHHQDFAGYENYSALIDSSAASYTVLLEGQKRHRLILVRLLWDRLVFERVDGELVGRSDAFTRIVAALAREIYGNVRSYSKNHRSPVSQVEREIAAYTTGVQTIERISQLTTESAFPSNFRSDIDAALGREREGLRGWQKFRAVKCEILFVTRGSNTH